MSVIINEKKTINFPKKTIVLAVTLLVVFVVLFSSITIVDAGHTGVINTLGHVSENVLQEGIDLKVTCVQTSSKRDNRIVKLEG